MSEEILINVTPQETRVAIVQEAVVQELHIERTSHLGLVGNIYKGEVCRVLPGMQSAFVEIGLNRAAFLHIADLVVHGEVQPPIQDILREGQSIVVQVIKDPLGSKGARLTTQISIAGRFLVYLPEQAHIGVSQRIENEEERETLRNRLLGLIPENHQGGFIIRTQAETATDEELLADVDYLHKKWQNVLADSQAISPKSLIHQDLSLPLRVLRDFERDDISSIAVDSRETFLKMQEFATRYAISALNKLQHYAGDRPLFDLRGVEDEIEKALSRKVTLKSGGYLIFDQTEALTTVDVNTGGFVGGRSLEDTIFRTNLEAAQTIARQLRLRNLGGIIIIDFIDMKDETHQDTVLQELQKAVSTDRARINIHGFSGLGLVEMTRKRTRESLAHILCEPCPSCQGRGEVKTAQSACYEILRAVLREHKQFNAREYRILASPKVIELFLDEESQTLAMLCEFIGKPVSLQADPLYGQESFDIVLM
ncbi:MAG TPA: ribonuclease G [Methylophilaceae bacterium]|jgi:ribonuclease G